ncbi:MAG: hypothetical protein AAFX65_12035 [Cyanobacteria bacterium J06638_7]
MPVARRTERSPSALIRDMIAEDLRRQPPPTPEQLRQDMREEAEELLQAMAHDAGTMPLEESTRLS